MRRAHAGIEIGLHIVERFADRELAARTAPQLDHAWSDTSEAEA